MLEEAVGLQEGEDTGVSGCVAKASNGALEQCCAHALVVAADAAVVVERLGGRGGRSPVAVLVVHDCADGHEKQHLENHGCGAAETAAQGPL